MNSETVLIFFLRFFLSTLDLFAVFDSSPFFSWLLGLFLVYLTFFFTCYNYSSLCEYLLFFGLRFVS